MDIDKKALASESKSIADNIINTSSITHSAEFDFVYSDFGKSGIANNIIDEYISEKLVTVDEYGYFINYLELDKSTKSNYYNKRLINYIKNKYIKAKGECSKVFIPLHLRPECFLNPQEYIIITEGEKKSIKAVQEGFNCIALSGVDNWKKQPKHDDNNETANGEPLDAEDIIPDIANANFKGKEIYLCYDSDMWDKPQVRRALYSFACYLISEKKAKVKIIMLPKGDAKGLDDYLIAYGKEAFQELFDNAKEYSLKDIQDILSGNNKKLEFPINIFKDDIRDCIIDLQKRLDAPLEYIAGVFISGSSVLMDGKYSIIVDKNKNWVEYPILWTAMIGNPSQKKTPCLSYGKKIIDELQEILTEKYNYEYKKYCEDVINYKIDMKQYEQQRLKNSTAKMPEAPQEPCREIITSQSNTVEALAKALSKNNGRSLAIWVDELASLLNGMGQYKGGKGNDLEYFLQSWKKQNYTVLRSNQENSFTVRASHNIIGSIQPKVLTKTLFNNQFESSNGNIERWLYVCSDYEETGNEYKSDKPYSVDIIKNVYERLFSTQNEVQCNFSTTAQNLFNTFCKQILKEKKKNITDLMKSYIQKQTDYVARFSLILHCIKNNSSNEISHQTVADAIALSKYFITCFDKISGQNCDYNPLEAQTLDYLRTKGLMSISPSKLHKNNTSRYKTISSARIILETLANKGYGRLQKTKNGGVNFIYYS